MQVGNPLPGVEGLQQFGHAVNNAAGRGRDFEEKIVFDVHDSRFIG